MKNETVDVTRRTLLTGVVVTAAGADLRAGHTGAGRTTLENIPLGPAVTITVERRGQIALVGINRPAIQNRIDPQTRLRLNEALYRYEHDSTLRALVLFGHGPNFSRGIDVDAAGRHHQRKPRDESCADTRCPRQHWSSPHQTRRRGRARGHVESGSRIYLACDIRVAAANTNFGQDEDTHGRFPGGGATVRFCARGWLGQRDAVHADRRSLDG